MVPTVGSVCFHTPCVNCNRIRRCFRGCVWHVFRRAASGRTVAGLTPSHNASLLIPESHRQPSVSTRRGVADPPCSQAPCCCILACTPLHRTVSTTVCPPPLPLPSRGKAHKLGRKHREAWQKPGCDAVNLLMNNEWKCLWRGHPVQPYRSFDDLPSAPDTVPNSAATQNATLAHCERAHDTFCVTSAIGQPRPRTVAVTP